MTCHRGKLKGVYGDTFLCTGSYSEPGETECREMIWSAGKACKKCDAKCYRVGWSEPQVRADNARRVREKHNVTKCHDWRPSMSEQSKLKLPLRRDDEGEIRTAGDNAIAVVFNFWPNEDNSEEEALADLIIRAVNCHERAQLLLKECLEILHKHEPRVFEGGALNSLTNDVTTMLAEMEADHE